MDGQWQFTFFLSTLIENFPHSRIPKDIIDVVIFPLEVDGNWFSVADIMKSISETMMNDDQDEGPDYQPSSKPLELPGEVVVSQSVSELHVGVLQPLSD